MPTWWGNSVTPPQPAKKILSLKESLLEPLSVPGVLSVSSWGWGVTTRSTLPLPPQPSRQRLQGAENISLLGSGFESAYNCSSKLASRKASFSFQESLRRLSCEGWGFNPEMGKPGEAG